MGLRVLPAAILQADFFFGFLARKLFVPAATSADYNLAANGTKIRSCSKVGNASTVEEVVVEVASDTST